MASVLDPAISAYMFIWGGYTHLSHFETVLHVAFDCNIAYAALVRTGMLQGNYLESFVEHQHSRSKVAHDLLKSEHAEFEGITVNGDYQKCLTLVAEARRRIDSLVPKFAIVSVVAMFIAILLLFVSAIDGEYEVQSVLGLLAGIILFSPVPIGLAWTYRVSATCEGKIIEEYKKFFDACDHVGQTPKDEIKRQVNDIRAKLNAKPPGIFRRFLTVGG
jgi:hypothetical protein